MSMTENCNTNCLDGKNSQRWLFPVVPDNRNHLQFYFVPFVFSLSIRTGRKDIDGCAVCDDIMHHNNNNNNNINHLELPKHT
jgi:hypothetical protein